MSPVMSVVIAARGRSESAARLLRQLAAQTQPAATFEVIVVDDGSVVPLAPSLAHLDTPYQLECLRIEWSGPAAARHHGAVRARGGVIVFLDDDMQIGEAFLAAHQEHHLRHDRAVVLGRIDPDTAIAGMPLFERYHARQLARWQHAVEGGTLQPCGLHLCTGNVSMRRADYFAIGGFNTSLERSEDRELGIRLDADGCAIIYGANAVSVHSSDHTDLGVWLRRAAAYGRVDRRIALMHPESGAHPWRFWPLLHAAARPVVALALLSPGAGRHLARLSFATAAVADQAGLAGVAVRLCALAYALQYYAAYRADCGSLAVVRCERRHEHVGTAPGPLRRCLAAIRADHNMMRQQRLKYHGQVIRASQLPFDLISRIGFQMLACYRVMRLAAEWRVPLVPMVLSRLIRHVYSAEIHWNAKIAPGVSIVHGLGLVLSHAAEIGPGCILFQNVTLGESIDAATGRIGAPRLGANVHVGPGATLLGPIDVGPASKVAAGVVLMESVPPSTLVMPPKAVLSARCEPAARTITRAA